MGYFYSYATRLYTPLCRSVGPSVGQSHFTLFFCFFCGLWPHCSCSNDLVTSITAPAHLHATGVAMYPALFLYLFFLPDCFCPNALVSSITTPADPHAPVKQAKNPNYALPCGFGRWVHPVGTSSHIFVTPTTGLCN